MLEEMFENVLQNDVYYGAVILFGIGLATLLFHKNMIKKIIGLNIMDTAIYLFLTAQGYIQDRVSPIITDGILPRKNISTRCQADLC